MIALQSQGANTANRRKTVAFRELEAIYGSRVKVPERDVGFPVKKAVPETRPTFVPSYPRLKRNGTKVSVNIRKVEE